MPTEKHPNKGPWIIDMKEGQQFRGFYLARNPSLQPFRDAARGKFLCFNLVDRTGQIEARAWDNAETFHDILNQSSIVKVEARLEKYEGRRQVIIQRLRAAQEHEFDRTDMRRSTERDVQQMIAVIDAAIESVSNHFLQTLLAAFYHDPERREQIISAPAASRIHHAYLGGLLEHTYEVLLLSQTLEQLYPEIDHDLLTTGILLHDIGKIQEYRWDTDIEITDAGRLIGHLALGIQEVSRAIASIPDFPETLAQRIQHLILSHHGHYEYGSPRRPKMLEAIALHHLEFLDAQVNRFKNLIREARAAEQDWTTYDSSLGRSLYSNHSDDLMIEEQGLTD